MIKPTFEVEETYLPISMKQFETLTNEILLQVNPLIEPDSFNGDFMAQVVMGCIHGMDKKQGTVKKSELFERCIAMISNQVTFHAVKAIEARLSAEKAKNDPQPLAVVPDSVEQ